MKKTLLLTIIMVALICPLLLLPVEASAMPIDFFENQEYIFSNRPNIVV